MSESTAQLKVGAALDGSFETVTQTVKTKLKELSNTAKDTGDKLGGMGDGTTQSAQKVEQATKSMVSSIQRTTALMDSGARGSVEYYKALANQRGIDSNVLKPYLDQLEAVKVKQAQAASAMLTGSQSLDKVGMSAAATANALRGVPAQFTDIVTSIQGGQAPLTVFLQQGGQLKDMFGGAGNAAKALGGYVLGLINPYTLAAGAAAGLAIAYEAGAAESRAFNSALILSGNQAGVTTGQLMAMASSIDQISGTQGAAAEALGLFAASGKIGAENLEQFTLTAIRFEKVTGTAIGDTVKKFEELRKAPLEATLKLNETMGYLTQTVYDQIKALTEQGRVTDAAALAQEEFNKATAAMAGDMEKNLGTVQRSWMSVKSAVVETWDAIKGIGRDAGLEGQVAAAQKMVDIRKQAANSIYGNASDLVKLSEAENQLKGYQELLKNQQLSAQYAAERTASVKSQVEFDKESDKYLSKSVQMQQAIAAAQERFAKVSQTPENLAKYTQEVEGIQKKFEETTKKATTARAAVNQAAKDDIAAARLMADLKTKFDGDEIKRLEKTRDELEKTMEAYAKASEAGVSNAIAAATAAETELATYGLLKSAVQELTLTNLEQARESAAMAGEDVANIEKRIAAQKRLIAATKGIEGIKTSEEAAKLATKSAADAAAEWKKTSDSINSTLTDALMRGFESGKDFARNLRDTVVNMFKTLVLRPIISAVINPVAGALTGALGLSGAASAAGAVGTAGAATGLAGTLAGFAATAASWGTAAGAGFMATLGGSTIAGGGAAGILAAGGAAGAGTAGMIGALGPYALAALAVLAIHDMTQGETRNGAKYGVGADGLAVKLEGPSGGEIAATQAQAMFNVAKSSIEGMLTGFGSKAVLTGFTAGLESSENGKGFAYATGQINGKSFGDVNTYMNSRGDKTQEQALKDYQLELTQSILEGLQVTEDIPASIAKLISDGLNGSEVKNLSLEATSAILANVETLSKQVATFGAAMTQLPFEKLKNLSFDTAAGLIAAAGGFEKLDANLGSYYANFYREDEKRAQSILNLESAFAALGKTMPVLDESARDVYRSLVEEAAAKDLSVEANAKAYASILSLNGAMNELAPAFDAVAEKSIAATEAANLATKIASSERRDLLDARAAKDAAQAEALKVATEAFTTLTTEVLTLREALLLAGDAAGAVSNQMRLSKINYNDFGGTENFNAGKFNAAYAIEQAKAAQGMGSQASANALNTQNVGGLLAGLMSYATSEEITRPIYIGIRDAIVEASGTVGEYVVRDSVDALSKVLATSQAKQQYGMSGPGLLGIYNAQSARAELGKSQTVGGVLYAGDTAIEYAKAVERLNGEYQRGTIDAKELSGAMGGLQTTLGDLSAYAQTEESLAASRQAAAEAVVAAGFSSINYYFGQISTAAGELAKSVEALASPLGLATAAIGRLNSVTTVFSASATAALSMGSTGMGAESAALISKSTLIAEAASIASAVLTTSDAAAAAKRLAESDAFANLSQAGIRDAALLLDGLKQYDATSFEQAFLRINNALVTGKVTDAQYQALFTTAIDTFQGVDVEANAVKTAMQSLADAMGGFADKLLIDSQKTTLTAGQTLAEIERQYGVAYTSAMTGDSASVSNFQSLAGSMLNKGQYANQGEYNAAFGRVYGDSRNLENIGVSTVAQTNNNVVSELKSLNTNLSNRVESLEKNLTAALATIAKNTSKTAQGIEQQNTVGVPVAA